jgi:flagellar hook-associated protein 1 FlgK
MGSTFFGLNIGQTGLYAYQAALDTTAHNIANTETPGYTRQVMGQQAGKALRVNSTYGMAGTGVTVLGVNQLRELYYDEKFWKNSTSYGEYNTKAYYMNEIQNYFNEVSLEGFTTTFNSFNSCLQELSKNPANLTVRTQLINYAQSFTEYFNSVSQNLKSIQEECNFDIRNKVDQINSLAKQIATATKQINTIEVNGGTANDLRDQRALLVDELSEIANITVTEQVIGQGVSLTSYVVKLNGSTLVDGSDFNTLEVRPREQKINQTDIDGIYDIYWTNGQHFNQRSSTLGGTLQALLEVRDGNNQFYLHGRADTTAGDSTLRLSGTNINSIEKLNIPQQGIITIDNIDYKYLGFQVTIDEVTNEYTYEFELEKDIIRDSVDAEVRIGESIDYKGIPYYMNQMNEFIRTFAMTFNGIHREGVNLEGEKGTDVFTAMNKVNGRYYTFGPIEGSPDEMYYDKNVFNSRTGSYFETTPDSEPMYGSYYLMTAENFMINSDMILDPNLFAASTDVVNGSENNDLTFRLINIKESKLFKQGTAEAFFQSLVAEVGIDTLKANNFSDNQTNILNIIQNQRLSVSGVDIDEEAMNLVRYQNAYNLSAKVISVMDEIYDKLINYMGV